MSAPVFYYDLSSPYAWLAAERIESVLPRPPVWQPISYAFVNRRRGHTPWSLQPGREERMREIEARATERGLHPMRWPQGWPVETYSLPALRAVLVAAEHGRAAELTRAAFRLQFTEARGLNDPEAIRDAARDSGLDPDAILEAIEREEIKEELKRATNEAVDLGLTGIPTVRVGEQLFWGDDRLEEAALAL